MVKRGRHAADDGSFGRSAGMAAGRGAALLAVAVVLGIVLLNATDDGGGQVTAGPSVTADTKGRGTTSTVPTSTTTTLPARPPAEVKVLTVNGTDVKGAAGKARDILRTGGYNVLAPVTGTPGPATTVYYAPTFDREAGAVAQALALPPGGVQPLPTPPPIADVRGTDVLVVVGPDLAARLITTTTTTKAAGATSTTRAAGPTSSTTRAQTSSSTTSTTRAG